MFIFAVVVSSVLGLMWLTVWFRLIETSNYSDSVRFFILAIFVLGYLLQTTRWFLMRRRSEMPLLVIPAYFLMGLMAHLFLASLFKDSLLILGDSLNPDFFEGLGLTDQRIINQSAIGICFFANIWGTWTALKGPEIQFAEVPVPQWPIGDSIRIAQVSDLHVGPLIRKDYVQKVVNEVNGLQSDLVVITGDLGDGNVYDLVNDLQPLKEISARLGVYFVTGNHEYYWNAANWCQIVQSLGIRVLENQGLSLPGPDGELWLGGVPDISCHHFVQGLRSDPNLAIIGSGDAQFKVLLAHQPKSAFAAEAAGFHLMLSGHTHKGQFFPFNLLVGFFNPHVQGLNKQKNMWVYVNQGTGFWGPPLRLGVPSEITLLTLKGNGVKKTPKY